MVVSYVVVGCTSRCVDGSLSFHHFPIEEKRQLWLNAIKRKHLAPTHKGAGCSSEVERSLMVRWVVGSILHGVDPLSYFSFQPVLHDWCNKGRGMCYPV